MKPDSGTHSNESSEVRRVERELVKRRRGKQSNILTFMLFPHKIYGTKDLLRLDWLSWFFRNYEFTESMRFIAVNCDFLMVSKSTRRKL